MPAHGVSQTEAETTEVKQLTQYLMSKGGYSGREDSPIENMVKAQISALARDIAAQVVAENPGLKAKIEAMTRDAVARTLADESWLNTRMVKAVSEALLRTTDDA